MGNGSRQVAWEFFGAELKRRRAYDLLRAAGGVPRPDRIGGGGPQTMREYDLSLAQWHKSSYSNGEGARAASASK